MRMICVTNEMTEARSCVVPKQHTPVCDDITCPGCLPREASVGYLCDSCFHKLEQVYATWADYANALNPDGRLAGVVRAVQTERVGATSPQLGHVNVSATALALDECWSYLRSLVGHPSILTWVNTKTGAADAVRFTRAASATYRAHPIVDRGRKLRRVRCPKCQQLTLVQKPPAEGSGLAPGAEGPKPVRALITVECQNSTCAHTFLEGDHAEDGGDLIDTVNAAEAAPIPKAGAA